MTREEAIKTWLPIIVDGVKTMPELEEALNMAIEALNQEPCEDAISRQAYIERYKKWGYSEYGRKMDNEVLAIRVAMSLPSVTPKPKTGHWIEGQTDNPNIHNILCSCCFEGYPSKGHANSQYTKEKFQWCPKCGARMIELQESEVQDASSD